MIMGDDKRGPPDATGPPEPRRISLRRLTSLELLGEANEVIIVHGAQEYRLRRTRQDKLILIK